MTTNYQVNKNCGCSGFRNFGSPPPQFRPDFEEMKNRIDSQLINAGATEEEIASLKGGADVEALAEKYGVELPKPPMGPPPGNNIWGEQRGRFGDEFEGGPPNPEAMKAKIDAKLQKAGATDEEIASISSPEDVQALADKYGVKLPKPPHRGGRPDEEFGNRPDPEEMKAKIDAKLKAAGATDEEIASISSPEDVQALADKYGVTLPPPPPPRRPQGQDRFTSMSGNANSTGFDFSALIQLLMPMLQSMGINFNY